MTFDASISVTLKKEWKEFVDELMTFLWIIKSPGNIHCGNIFIHRNFIHNFQYMTKTGKWEIFWKIPKARTKMTFNHTHCGLKYMSNWLAGHSWLIRVFCIQKSKPTTRGTLENKCGQLAHEKVNFAHKYFQSFCWAVWDYRLYF